MASFCRSAIAAGSRSVAARSKTTTQTTLNAKTIFSSFSSPARPLPRASRVVSALGSVESLLPLHSAIASARLKSSIAVDSTCWGWLSQGIPSGLLLKRLYAWSWTPCSDKMGTEMNMTLQFLGDKLRAQSFQT